MAALTGPRMQVLERWTHHQFRLAAGERAWRGGVVAGNMTTGRVEAAGAGADLIAIGYFDEDVDATGGERAVTVDLGVEIEVRWLENDGSITDADVFSLAYVADDQTVTTTAGASPVAGRIWAVEADRGVAVQQLRYAGA